MKEVLKCFSVNCYSVQFLVLFSTLSITFLTLFLAQSTAFPNPKNLCWIEICSLYPAPRFIIYLYIWWCKVVGFFGICPLVCPAIMTATVFFSCLFPTFGLHILIYAWYNRIKESNENRFYFSIIDFIVDISTTIVQRFDRSNWSTCLRDYRKSKNSVLWISDVIEMNVKSNFECQNLKLLL